MILPILSALDLWVVPWWRFYMKNCGTTYFLLKHRCHKSSVYFQLTTLDTFYCSLNACCTCLHNHKLMSTHIYFWETFVDGFEYDSYSCKWWHILSDITNLYYFCLFNLLIWNNNVVLVILVQLNMKFNNFQSFVCYEKYSCIADCPFFHIIFRIRACVSDLLHTSALNWITLFE